MADVLKGKPVAEAIDARTKALVSDYKNAGTTPKLVVLRIGENDADVAYERTVMKRAEKLHIEAEVRVLSADVSQAQLETVIEDINNDSHIHGCLMFRPLPQQIDEMAICNMLSPEKDVDGIGAKSLAGVFMGLPEGFAPCTAQACVELLDFYNIALEGKHVAVVGRSLVVGRPLACLLLARNATVTVAHSRTADLPEITRSADIVVCATGRARAFTTHFFHKKQTVLDVGTNVDDAGVFCGDVDYDDCEPEVNAITPVPGGIGTITTSVLLNHVAQAAAKNLISNIKKGQ